MSIVVGLLGACTSLIGVLVGAWINNKRQDRRWLRDKKLEGAAEFISAAGRLYEHRRPQSTPQAVPSDAADWGTQMQRGRSVIYLLCSAETTERAEDLARMVWDDDIAAAQHREKTIETLRAFTQQMRAEISR